MRYSIMLQIVTGLTLILLSGAALFAWIQNRPPETNNAQELGIQDIPGEVHI